MNANRPPAPKTDDIAEWSAATRKQNLIDLQAEIFDLVVIGGGITGAGIARDAAGRGMRVALVEARDFAFGTSSRSSKLVHGGIRYLENLEFKLVFEALSERQILAEIAPHLVHPLRFVLPIYRGGRIGMLKLGLGMWLYDALSLFDAPESHDRMSAKETLAQFPALKAEGLLGAYSYHDAYMDDDLLVIETLRSAVQLGALAVNYVEAVSAHIDGKNLVSIEVVDKLTGPNFAVRGRQFVSSVGPWTDQLGERFCKPWQKLLRPSKGIHLTLPRQRLQIDQALVMADDAQSRIVFAIPRHEMAIIGTTDTAYTAAPDEVQTKSVDVDYLLAMANEYFPEARLTRTDFIASYAGVRPLVRDEAASEGRTSREHLILQDPNHLNNLTLVAGGKYTTYRLMAEQTVNLVVQRLALEDRVRFTHSRSTLPLHPWASADNLWRAKVLTATWQSELPELGIEGPELEFLAMRFAMEAESLLHWSLPTWSAELSSEERMWLLIAQHAALRTMCLRLDDFFLRRTHLVLARPDHGRSLWPLVARLFSEHFGWSPAETERQLSELEQLLEKELAWKGI